MAPQTPSILDDLGLGARYGWYTQHSLPGTWECFVYDLPGKLPSCHNTELHKIIFGPERSSQDIAPLSKESLHALYSLKPGPIPGMDLSSLGIRPASASVKGGQPTMVLPGRLQPPLKPSFPESPKRKLDFPGNDPKRTRFY